jgi:hypothetical protein
MLSETDVQALMQAAMARLQITIMYQKVSGDMSMVSHTGGVVEINSDTGFLWLWDTSQNDHIRRFYLQQILSMQVLQTPFDSMSAGGYPLKINGEIMPEMGMTQASSAPAEGQAGGTSYPTEQQQQPL